MPYPQKHPLRAFTEQEERALSRIAKADSERVDTVRRAKALIAVNAGVPFAEVARAIRLQKRRQCQPAGTTL